MRFKHPVALLIACFFCASILPAQTQDPQPVRDESAINDLKHALTVLTNGTLPLDADMFGSMSISGPDAQKTYQVEIRCKGSRKIKTFVQKTSGTSIFVLRDGDAHMKGQDGTTLAFQPLNTATQTPEYLPFLLLSELNDVNMAVTTRENDTVAGTMTRIYELHPVPPPKHKHFADENRLKPVYVSIDPATSHILRMEQTRYSENGKFQHKVETIFSDYRVIDGISVPLMQQTFVDGRLRSTLRLNNVKFNTGYADSDFDLAQ